MEPPAAAAAAAVPLPVDSLAFHAFHASFAPSADPRSLARSHHDAITHQASQLAAALQQLDEARWHLKASRQEVASLKRALSEKDQLLAQAAADAQDLQQQLQDLQHYLHWVLHHLPPPAASPPLTMRPPTPPAAPLLTHILHRLRLVAPPPPPPFAAPPLPLLLLPAPALQLITRLAGPHTRQVCRALRDLHGPPPRLRPTHYGDCHDPYARGLATLTRPHLLASLTDLDLTGALTSDFTDAALPALAAHATRLTRLALANAWAAPDTGPHWLASLPRSIRHLRLWPWQAADMPPPTLSPSAHTAAPPPAPLTALRELRLCIAPSDDPPNRLLAPLITAPHLRRLELWSVLSSAPPPAPGAPPPDPLAAARLLPRLAPLTALVHLKLLPATVWDDAAVAALRRLRGLTFLGFGLDMLETTASPVALFDAVASLPTLLELHLQGRHVDTWGLPYLTHLSSLRLRALTVAASTELLSASDVVEARTCFPVMPPGEAPAYHHLTHLSVSGGLPLVKGYLTRPFERLAPSLRHLALDGVVVPPGFLRLLRGFHRLRGLVLGSVRAWSGEGAVEGRWDELGALTQLESLSVGADARGLAAIGALTRLTFLSLAAGGLARGEEGACWALLPLQRLRVLELGGGVEPVPALLAVLVHLRALRVVEVGQYRLSAADVVQRARAEWEAGGWGRDEGGEVVGEGDGEGEGEGYGVAYGDEGLGFDGGEGGEVGAEGEGTWEWRTFT